MLHICCVLLLSPSLFRYPEKYRNIERLGDEIKKLMIISVINIRNVLFVSNTINSQISINNLYNVNETNINETPCICKCL